jgi:DNA-binding GntR family transcriptional regulator
MAVFQGAIESGQRLIVQRLSEQFEVSPTPVRESLVELSSLGIVDLLPNRGAVVLPFGANQVREIGQLRRVLEVEATRCAAGRICVEELTTLIAQFQSLRVQPPGEPRDRDGRLLDTRIHGLIADSCGSARLTAEINRYLTLFRILRDVSHLRDAATNYSRSDDIPQHLDILKHLATNTPKSAAEAMDRHIHSSTQAIAEVLFSNTDHQH